MAKLSLRRIAHSLMELGPRAFLASGWRKFTSAFAGSRPVIHDQTWTNETARETGDRVHPFDEQHGTDTSGVIAGESLSTGSRNDRWNTAYYGISPSVFHHLASALDLDWPRFTFVDLGSGKGRALLLASRYPWRAILGVELDHGLNEIAKTNIGKLSEPWQRCRSLEAVEGDAALFKYPPGPLVVFLYHPFLSPVLKRCLKGLAQSLAADPREAYIVYVNPILADLIQRVPKMVKVWERTFNYSEEDARSDQLGGTGDRVAVWRYLP